MFCSEQVDIRVIGMNFCSQHSIGHGLIRLSARQHAVDAYVLTCVDLGDPIQFFVGNDTQFISGMKARENTTALVRTSGICIGTRNEEPGLRLGFRL